MSTSYRKQWLPISYDPRTIYQAAVNQRAKIAYFSAISEIRAGVDVHKVRIKQVYYLASEYSVLAVNGWEVHSIYGRYVQHFILLSGSSSPSRNPPDQ